MHANRLIQEKSPYLLQHAHNPVDWYPWGDEAFEKARREDKPIFLSIGYSTCHWCHVMERESFENEAIAELVNRWFVPIKVDREERPDIDRIYMNYVQSTTGGGGWPMSVWLTPELKPFVGGTYFPPENRYGRAGFPLILERIAQAWKTERSKIEENSNGIMEQLAPAGRLPRKRAPIIWKFRLRIRRSISSAAPSIRSWADSAPRQSSPGPRCIIFCCVIGSGPAETTRATWWLRRFSPWRRRHARSTGRRIPSLFGG